MTLNHQRGHQPFDCPNSSPPDIRDGACKDCTDPPDLGRPGHGSSLPLRGSTDQPPHTTRARAVRRGHDLRGSRARQLFVSHDGLARRRGLVAAGPDSHHIMPVGSRRKNVRSKRGDSRVGAACPVVSEGALGMHRCESPLRRENPWVDPLTAPNAEGIRHASGRANRRDQWAPFEARGGA